MLVDVLHEYLGLTGTRFGCGQGVCRACTVIVDDADGPREVRSCITGAHYFDGKRIRTVEGHARRDDSGKIAALSPVQQAFLDHFSFQCGYCTPGFVNAATVLLERLQKSPVAAGTRSKRRSPRRSIPHLCRCTGYVRYYQAVKALVLNTPGLVREDAPMTRVGWRRIVAWLLVALLLWLLLLAVLRFFANRGPVQQVHATPQQIAHGRYLAAAADCAACHTAPGGAPFAGGVPLASPFGTIHGTNITPDAETGIGRYTSDDFFHAMAKGEARDGHQLYPAMPYVSYKNDHARRQRCDLRLSDEPAGGTAAEQEATASASRSTSAAASICGTCCSPARESEPASKGASPSWQRGRYLVETLGHCGECHSPRGALGQVDRDRPLAGNSELGRFAAPDITPAGLAARGWDAAMLRDYLGTGVSARAVASDEMLPVVTLSTSQLNDGRSGGDDCLPARRPAAGAAQRADRDAQRIRGLRTRPPSLPQPVLRLPRPRWRRRAARGAWPARQQQRARCRSAQPHRRHPRRPARTRSSRLRAHAGHAGFRRMT